MKKWKFCQILLLSIACSECASLTSDPTKGTLQTKNEITPTFADTKQLLTKSSSTQSHGKEISKRNVASVARARSFGMVSPYGSEDDEKFKRNVASVARARSFGMISPSRSEHPYFSNFGKRHFSSLLRFRQTPLYFGNNFEDSPEKRSFRSILDTVDAPEEIILQPTKKHISSLIRNRNNYGKRNYEDDYEIGLDNEAEQVKRHVGSIRNRLYGYLFNLPTIDKRYFGALLKSQQFRPRQMKRYLGSIMKKNANGSDEGEKIEYDYVLNPWEEDEINEALRDKKHIASLVRNRQRMMYKRDASLKNENQEKTDLQYLGITADKRHLSSLFQNNEYGMQKGHHLSSLRQNGGEEPVKRHYSALLQNQDEDIDKRHISTLLDKRNEEILKRYYSSLMRNHDEGHDKRHLASLLQNGVSNLEKRHYASLLQNKDGSFDPLEKRHISSLLQNVNDPIEKKHIGSFYRSQSYNKRTSLREQYPNDFDDEVVSELHNVQPDELLQKRFFRTLLRDELDTEKRNIASIMRTNRVENIGSEDWNDGESNAWNEEKRHIASLRQGKRDSVENMVGIKRYISSRMNDKINSETDMAEEKRHIASLKQRKRNLEEELSDENRHVYSLGQDKWNPEYDLEEKRHIASLRQGKRELENYYTEEKRQISSIRQIKRNNFPEIEDEHQHLSSMKSNMMNSDFGEDITVDDRHVSNLESLISMPLPNGDDKRSFVSLLKSSSYSPHTRTKRYLGALAKNNNLPFRQSRGYSYPGGGYYSRSLSFVDYIEKYIRDQLKKESVLKHLRKSGVLHGMMSEDKPMDDRDIYIIEDPNTENIDLGENNIPISYSNDGFFRTQNKRYLGSLARQNWFPRPYRRSDDELISYRSSSFPSNYARYPLFVNNRPSYGAFIP